MPKQIVVLNEERVRHIRLASRPVNGAKTQDVPPGPLITLGPGVNLIEEALWKEALENPNVASLLTTLVPPGPANNPIPPERVGQPIIVAVKVVDDVRPLAALSPLGAVDMVRETLDKPMLMVWLNDEKRAPVREAIEMQLKLIEAPPPDGTPRGKPGARAPRPSEAA